jgi:hypothetical protein
MSINTIFFSLIILLSLLPISACATEYSDTSKAVNEEYFALQYSYDNLESGTQNLSTSALEERTFDLEISGSSFDLEGELALSVTTSANLPRVFRGTLTQSNGVTLAVFGIIRVGGLVDMALALSSGPRLLVGGTQNSFGSIRGGSIVGGGVWVADAKYLFEANISRSSTIQGTQIESSTSTWLATFDTYAQRYTSPSDIRQRVDRCQVFVNGVLLNPTETTTPVRSITNVGPSIAWSVSGSTIVTAPFVGFGYVAGPLLNSSLPVLAPTSAQIEFTYPISAAFPQLGAFTGRAQNPFTVTSPASVGIRGGFTPGTALTWSGAASPGSYFSTTIEGRTQAGGFVLVICTGQDDGVFSLPSDIAAILTSQQFIDGQVIDMSRFAKTGARYFADTLLVDFTQQNYEFATTTN